MTGERPAVLSPAARRLLLAAARDAVDATVRHRIVPVDDDDWRSGAAEHERLHHPGGAFVTLRVDGALRGCIGHVEADRALLDTIRRVAAAAAAEDPRFPPVTVDELPRIELEISVLGPPVEQPDPTAIEVGRHGLIVDDGTHRGLLLPQVAVEWGWDTQTFLAQTCQKAGLAADAWKRGATVSAFEAEVFPEKKR